MIQGSCRPPSDIWAELQRCKNKKNRREEYWLCLALLSSEFHILARKLVRVIIWRFSAGLLVFCLVQQKSGVLFILGHSDACYLRIFSGVWVGNSNSINSCKLLRRRKDFNIQGRSFVGSEPLQSSDSSKYCVPIATINKCLYSPRVKNTFGYTVPTNDEQ